MSEPEVLYKYVSAERALQALPEAGNGALRATQPASMNDPRECACQLGGDDLGDVNKEERIAEGLRLLFPETRSNEREVKSAVQLFGAQAWSHLVRKRLSGRFGVVSLSASPTDPLLWAHYGDSGYGVAIGYDTSFLRQIPREHEMFGEIQYRDELPRASDFTVAEPEQKLQELMLFKSTHWRYEEEWRLILELRNTVGTGKTDGRGFSINLCPIPNEAVVEVIVTERMGLENTDALNGRLANGSYRSERLERLVLRADSYEYGYEHFGWIDGEYTRQSIHSRAELFRQRSLPPETPESAEGS